jgi:hypothetical protein
MPSSAGRQSPCYADQARAEEAFERAFELDPAAVLPGWISTPDLLKAFDAAKARVAARRKRP